MIVLDVNVLVAAFRADHSHHPTVRPWFDRVLVTEEAIIVPDLSWVGFLRIVTNERVFGIPSTLDEALAFLEAVTHASSYRAMSGLSRGWSDFAELATDSRASGNLVPDAYLATIARSLACPIATMDRDFRRFLGLSIVDPG